MASDDNDILEGANASLRKLVSGIHARNMPAEDLPSTRVNAGMQYLRGHYDPRFRSESVGMAREFGDYAADAAKAADAPYGSIASRNDPNRYGSVASRKFKDVFGPDGAANPSAQPAPDVGMGAQQQQAALTGQTTAAYLAPLLSQFAGGMPRRDLRADFNGPSPVDSEDEHV